MKFPYSILFVSAALAACQPQTSQPTPPAPAPSSVSAAAPSIASASVQAASETKPAAAFGAELSQYKAYVQDEVAQLVQKTQQFTAAIKAGKLNEAQALYPQARAHYERIEPIAELFEDLDSAIDAREDDFKAGAKDPAFTGFHRLEYALWVDKNTQGMEAIADRLNADVEKLKNEINNLDFPASSVVGGAAELVEEIASGKISGEEDRYSHTDLSDFQANMDGVQKIVDLFRVQIEAQDEKMLPSVDTKIKQINDILAKYKTDSGFQTYDKLSEADRKALQAPIHALAEDLAKWRGLLGLD